MHDVSRVRYDPESNRFVRERVWEHLDEENHTLHQEWVSELMYFTVHLICSWRGDILIKAHHDGSELDLRLHINFGIHSPGFCVRCPMLRLD